MFNNNTIIVKKSGKQYVSLCLENMVVGCGISKEEAIENLKNAIRSYVDSTEDGMTLERPISLKLLHEFLAEDDMAGIAKGTAHRAERIEQSAERMAQRE